jgi:hypothetical protein
MLHATHASGAKGGPLHDQRVELHLGFAIEEATAASIEGLVVFHDHDCFLDGVECRASAAEHLPAGCSGVADAVEVSLNHVIRNGPGASMDNQNRINGQEKFLP